MTNNDDHICIDGRALEVRRIPSRTGSGPTLVFLHEGLGSAAQWKDFPDRLAAAVGWPALLYSRLGYGGSDPAQLPRPVSFLEDEAAALPRLLAAAGVDDAVLVGHSDGASIALLHAAASPPHPEGPVRAVIAEAPHVFVEEVTLRSIRLAGEAFRDGDLRRRLERYHGTNVDGAFWGFHDVWLDPGFRGWNIEHDLRGIRVPVLVIQGEDDPYGTMRQVQSIRDHAGGPVETSILEAPCGHAPHAARPDTVLAQMTSFLHRLEAPC